MILVSACLAGVRCRYDGNDNKIDFIEKMVLDGKAIPVCPEILGGLETPRTPAEIKLDNGELKIINEDEKDLTKCFIIGAEKTLEIAKIIGAKNAVLKSKSPSCGNKFVYDGNFNKTLVEGKGITASLLEKNGITVINEEEAEVLRNEENKF